MTSWSLTGASAPLRVLGQAKDEFPRQPAIWKNYGRAQLANDAPPAQAEASFRRALDLAGGNYPEARAGLNEALAAQGKPTEN